MADDLIKGEWSKSKFLDMMKEYPEKIAKINDETVKVLNEQLNSCDEVNLFKEEISKKKLISSKEYELNKNILFAYDTGVTVSQPITLSHDHNLLSADEEVQSDVEELGYNAPNTIEQPKLKVGKTVWKGIKHFAKAFLREGWNADITDFFDGTVRELSDFTMLVGETYDKDSRFRNNFDGVFSKIIGNSDSQYSSIIDSIVDKCVDEKVIEKTEDKSSKGAEHDVESVAGVPLTPDNEETDLDGINLDSSKKIFDKLNEIKPLLSFDSSIIDKIVQPDTENPGYYKYNFEPDKYIISDELSVKKYNVIINFTDYLINKWKKGALFSQMTKNSKAVNYPKTLTKFINNINFIIQDEKDAQTKTMKTVFLYQYMKKEQINKALAFMLYTIYLAKANFDNNKNISKENEAEKNKERFMNAIDKIYELIDAKPENTTYEVENTNYKVEKTTVDNHKGIIITLDKNKKYTIDWVKFTRNPMNNNTYIYRFLDNIAVDNLTIEKLLKSFVTFVTDKGRNNYSGMTEESL